MPTTIVSTGPWMIDANVLIYAAFPQSPWYGLATQRLQEARAGGVELVVSPQVLREFLVAATRPAPGGPPPPLPPILKNLSVLAAGFRVLREDAATVLELANVLSVAPAYGKQIHDANIVATMRVHGIPALLTNNTADFVRYANLITVIPLVP